MDIITQVKQRVPLGNGNQKEEANDDYKVSLENYIPCKAGPP